MPIDPTALSAALDAGIAEAGSAPTTPAPAPAATTTPEGSTDAKPVTTTPVAAGAPAVESGDPSGGEGGEPVAEKAGEGDGGSPAGSETPDGGAAGATGATGATGGDGSVGATGATGATGAAPVDETPDQQLERAINDPLPNALKKETKERFGMVVTALKDRTHQLQQVTGDLDTMLDSIQQTRATPAQYKQALDYLTLVNSDSAEDKQKALEFMQREIRALAVMIGKPVPGVNFLEGHQDLIQEVGEGKITPQRAMEIAAAREHNKRNAEVTQRVTAANNEQQTRQQVEARGRAELNALEQALKADPAYPAKRKILVESLRPVFAQIHPSQWAATFKRAYDNLPAPVAPVAPAPAAPVVKAPANTPLRASNPAGGQVAAPASALEALNAGIAAAG